MGEWSFSTVPGPAHRYLAGLEIAGRRVVVVAVGGPTLVLGSTQRDDAVDRGATTRGGVEVVRRRSGGSAVFVEPGRSLWLDVTIPAGDPLWDGDVGRAFHWLGRAWVAALGRIGVEAEWYDGPLRKSEWSPHVCFAGLGPGEVTIGGRKCVGMSQRRTRSGALFQTSVLLDWEPGRLLDLLALEDPARRRAGADLADLAVGIGHGRGEELISALMEVLAGL